MGSERDSDRLININISYIYSVSSISRDGERPVVPRDTEVGLSVDGVVVSGA